MDRRWDDKLYVVLCHVVLCCVVSCYDDVLCYLSPPMRPISLYLL